MVHTRNHTGSDNTAPTGQPGTLPYDRPGMLVTSEPVLELDDTAAGLAQRPRVLGGRGDPGREQGKSTAIISKSLFGLV